MKTLLIIVFIVSSLPSFATELTFAELNSCMQRETDIEKARESLKYDEEKLNDFSSSISKEKKYLEMTKSIIAGYNSVDSYYRRTVVAEYNDRVYKYQQSISDYNRKVNIYRADQNRFNSTVVIYNDDCASKQADEDDKLLACMYSDYKSTWCK